MDDRLVTIAEFQSDIEAQMAKAALHANDIDAIIVGESIKDLLPVDGMLNVGLQVFARDAERARAVLDTQQNQPAPEEGDQ
jgi:hypothetical protein